MKYSSISELLMSAISDSGMTSYEIAKRTGTAVQVVDRIRKGQTRIPQEHIMKKILSVVAPGKKIVYSLEAV